MATTAEGQHDGVTAAGPSNTFDGAGAHPEIDNRSVEESVTSGLRTRQAWQTGEGAPASSGFALGADRPD